MNQQSYQSLTNWFYQRPILNKILVSCCRLFPYSMFFLYAVGSVCRFSHFFFYGFDQITTGLADHIQNIFCSGSFLPSDLC